VVEGCHIPILVLGGSRQGSDEDALEVVRGVTLAGAAGVIFGRNVFQAADMQSFLRQARSLLDGHEILSQKR
jgi:DhnA family fructose-bisphosphate aldolase class Ia